MRKKQTKHLFENTGKLPRQQEFVLKTQKIKEAHSHDPDWALFSLLRHLHMQQTMKSWENVVAGSPEIRTGSPIKLSRLGEIWSAVSIKHVGPS